MKFNFLMKFLVLKKFVDFMKDLKYEHQSIFPFCWVMVGWVGVWVGGGRVGWGGWGGGGVGWVGIDGIRLGGWVLVGWMGLVVRLGGIFQGVPVKFNFLIKWWWGGGGVGWAGGWVLVGWWWCKVGGWWW